MQSLVTNNLITLANTSSYTVNLLSRHQGLVQKLADTIQIKSCSKHHRSTQGGEDVVPALVISTSAYKRTEMQSVNNTG